MNNYFIFISLFLTLLCSCTTNQEHHFDSVQNQNVDFTAINVTVSENPVDYARSIRYEYDFKSYEWREPAEEFRITWHYLNSDNTLGSSHGYPIELDKVNKLWIGGDNAVRVEFHPSCPEEKSSEFTFPDGTVVTLSRENPTVIWKLTPEVAGRIKSISNNNFEAPIYAISRFEKDGITYINAGFVVIFNEELLFDSVLYFDDSLNGWVWGEWLKQFKI